LYLSPDASNLPDSETHVFLHFRKKNLESSTKIIVPTGYTLEHNHSLGTAEVLYYTGPSKTVKQQSDEYFMGGMNVSEAIRAHQDYLDLSEGISEKKTFDSSALNPKPRTISLWCGQWRQKHLGPREVKCACEVGTVNVLSEQQLINKPVYQMHLYYLWLIF